MTDFDDWWEQSGKHYEAAVLERGGTPWTTDLHERRSLWKRRYQRPTPPAGLGVPDIRNCNREITERWWAAGWRPGGTERDHRPDGYYGAKPQTDYLGDLTA